MLQWPDACCSPCCFVQAALAAAADLQLLSPLQAEAGCLLFQFGNT